MDSLFQKALTYIFGVEGGYSVDPNPTNKGIQDFEYNAYRTSKGLPTQDVHNISNAEAADIYYQEYWTKSRAPGVPAPSSVSDPALQLVLFDTNVNPMSGIWAKVRTILAGPGTDSDKAGAIIDARSQLYKNAAPQYQAGLQNRLNTLRQAIGLGASQPPATLGGAAQGNWLDNLYSAITTGKQLDGSPAPWADPTIQGWHTQGGAGAAQAVPDPYGPGGAASQMLGGWAGVVNNSLIMFGFIAAILLLGYIVIKG